jgi:hypothetical protein
MMEYAKFLREEEEAHRQYLERLYTITILVLVGLLGFLHFKTKKDVAQAVDAQFQATVEKKLKDRMEQFDAQLEDATRKIEEQVEELDFQVKKLVERAATVPASIPPQRVTTSTLDKEDEQLLKLIGQSRYSFRTLNGISREAVENGIDKEKVRESFERLSQNGLIGSTLGKTGGVRWFITERGRRYLTSQVEASSV